MCGVRYEPAPPVCAPAGDPGFFLDAVSKVWKDARVGFPSLENRGGWFPAQGGPAAAVLRYQPGAKAPRHRHAGWERVIVIGGSQADAQGLINAGDVMVRNMMEEAARDGIGAFLSKRRS